MAQNKWIEAMISEGALVFKAGKPTMAPAVRETVRELHAKLAGGRDTAKFQQLEQIFEDSVANPSWLERGRQLVSAFSLSSYLPSFLP